jgi:hypothetical protein
MVSCNDLNDKCPPNDISNRNAEYSSKLSSKTQSFLSSMSDDMRNPMNVKECSQKNIGEDDIQNFSAQVNGNHEKVVLLENEEPLLTHRLHAYSTFEKESTNKVLNDNTLSNGDIVTKKNSKEKINLDGTQQATFDNFFHHRHRKGRSKTGPASTIAFPCRVPRGQMMTTCNISSFTNGTQLSPLGSSLESLDQVVSMNPMNGKTSLEHQRHEWITVFKRMFRDLAQQSDRTKQTIDKDFFLEYFPLPGVIGERLFDLFDVDKSKTIDFDEFFRGLSIIYNGTLEEKKRFLFNM